MPKKDNTNCCVYGCNSRRRIISEDSPSQSPLLFHYFPGKNTGKVNITNKFGIVESVDRRWAWDNALCMGKLWGKPSTKSMRVCSKHFERTAYITPYVAGKAPSRLKRTAVPSLNLPVKPNARQVIDSRRHARQERRQILREVGKDGIQDNTLSSLCTSANEVDENRDGYEVDGNEHGNEVEVNSAVTEANIVQRTNFHDLDENEQAAVIGLLEFNKSISVSNPSDKSVGTQVSSGDFLVKLIDSIKSDSELRSLTNINSLALLDTLRDLIVKHYPQKIVKLEVKEKIVMVFMKLKLSLSFKILSFLFKVTPSLCGKIFDKYIQILSKILASCIHWPSISECRKNLPLSFKEFADVRVVVDCTEIPIQKPKCLCCRVKTYSHYKGKHTIKVMTGVSPGGLLTFVSKGYGGRSSDKIIFEESGLINKLEPYVDKVMVDKGFLIDKVCEENSIKVVRPIFLRKKNQFTEAESKLNVKIAKARVHVERVNQRLRTFEILNGPLPWALAKSIDDIIVVCGAMVNLQSSIMSDDKFIS